MKQMLQSRKDIREKARVPIQGVLALAGTYGIHCVCALAGGTLFSNGIVSLMVFGVVWLLLQNTWSGLLALDGKQRKKRLFYGVILAFFFSACMIAGWQLRAHGMTESGFAGKGRLLLQSAMLTAAVFPFSDGMFALVDKLMKGKESDGRADRLWKSGVVFLIMWLLIFLAWIPSFLAYYPAIMSYDFHRQSIEAIKGFAFFYAYQPLAHTWLIWLFLQIGKALGSYQTGMAGFSLFQMLVFSASCSYTAVVIYRFCRKKWSLALLFCFYGLFPMISVHALCTTKDIMFTALFQLFLCLFLERKFLYHGKRKWLLDTVWLLEGIAMMLFRNNALYAVAVFMVLYCFMVGRKQWVRALVMGAVLVLGGRLALSGVQAAIGTKLGVSAIEMFSVPIQQFARVGYYHGEELDQSTHELLDTYVPEEYWKDYYPPLADSVKGNVGTVFGDAWENHYGRLFKDWLKIGRQYPNEYIDAFLLLTSGYWFPDDTTWAEVYGIGSEEHWGAIATYMSSASEVLPEGILHKSKWPAMEQLLESIISDNAFYGWPVVSNLFKPAFWCWGLYLILIGCLYTRSWKTLSVAALPFVYLGTMFLGPVVVARYALPIIVSVPLLFAAWIRECRTEND